MEVQNWIQIFANLGGLGALAWAVLSLHRDSIAEFAKQLTAERSLFVVQSQQARDANTDLWKSYMDLKVRQHEQLISLLVGQDKALDRIEGQQQRIIDILRPTHQGK